MFITKLMKIPNLAVSLAPHLEIITKDNQYKLRFSGTENLLDADADITKLLLKIKQEEVISLIALREYISHLSDASGMILLLHRYITWSSINLHIVNDDTQILLTIEPVGAENNLIDIVPLVEDKLILSRFVSLNREDDKVILSRTLEDSRLVIKDPRLDKLLFALFSGTSVAQLLTQYEPNMQTGVKLIMQVLLAQNYLIKLADGIPNRLEEGTQVDTQWDLNDIKFHTSSRFGYHFGQFGGGFPFVNLIEPRPAVRDLPDGKRIDLYTPDIKKLAQTDAPLTQIQMQRLSVRGYNEDKPINLKQIGEFLYRTARVLYETESEVVNVNDDTQKTNMSFAWRPYPTGGASYELEIYLTIDRAADLEPGMYYYAPRTHQLIQVSEKSVHTDTLIDFAHTSCAKIVKPQVLVHIAARFQRVSWKYHAIAYATMLRNTGVLYQTFYLNAIAMGIAPCGLGSGHLKAFAAASGNDPLVEGNIGEFMLGSLPENFDFSILDHDSVAKIHGAIAAGTSGE
ncbi:TOMM biosynthesis dehydrogenase (protein B) [uncultured Candidatus Thioglobus sp.]|nr:TOMM biosynthesis dehydrogenase (protein B) [uncultured Candidatus Thioglobus sp.]SMN00964.1 TOMM biosynthesis dehydrogenase (protein B) [uncultured Candidatus Thioglobus sp.]